MHCHPQPHCTRRSPGRASENAIYWLNVLITHGGKSAQATAAKQLWIMAAEDVDDPAIVLRAFAVFQMAGRVPETDHLFFLTSRMCRAAWRDAGGRTGSRAGCPRPRAARTPRAPRR